MTEPVVSVVMRAFNCERYIGPAIESILAQTFQDFEVVVVDDASTDGTEAILRAYAHQDERIKVFRNQTNQGAVRNMNISLRHARGEFVAVHDSDDVSLPHRLETQVNFLRANPHIALVGGGAYIIDEEGEEIKVVTRERRGPEEVRQDLEKGSTFTQSSVTCRRECLEAIGLYDEFFSYANDYDMLFRVSDQFGVVYYEEPLVKRRWLNSSISGTKNRAQAAFFELARMRNKAQKEGASLDLQREYHRLMARKDIARRRPISDAYYYYCIGMFLLDRGKPQKARKRFLRALKCGGDINAFLRAFVFYVLSFFPNSIHTKPVRALRKAF